jgi:hypothetical protein
MESDDARHIGPEGGNMQILLKCLWIAGLIQMAIFLANFYLPFKLKYRQNISSLAPFFRQVFITHAGYVAGVVLLFSTITFVFAADLASGHGLGRFLAAAMCVFWVCRIPLQLFYYDASIRRANRAGEMATIGALLFLAVTYGAAAFVPNR